MDLPEKTVSLQSTDALVVVDVQRDFLPAGALAVPHGDEVVPVINRYIALFHARGLPVIFTRDWHPANHCSFQQQGGPWPEHCVADTSGAAFAPNLLQPADSWVISKATEAQQDAYSGFQGAGLAQRLQQRGCQRLYICGLATDYCVLETVKDALTGKFRVFLLQDAIRAVDVHADDGARAIRTMQVTGASILSYDDLCEAQP